MPLIEDIRTHILDPKFPLTSILRETLVLARKLRSEELTKWVNSELEGYKGSKEELPNYRKYKAYSTGSGVKSLDEVERILIQRRGRPLCDAASP